MRKHYYCKDCRLFNAAENRCEYYDSQTYPNTLKCSKFKPADVQMSEEETVATDAECEHQTANNLPDGTEQSQQTQNQEKITLPVQQSTPANANANSQNTETAKPEPEQKVETQAKEPTVEDNNIKIVLSKRSLFYIVLALVLIGIVTMVLFFSKASRPDSMKSWNDTTQVEPYATTDAQADDMTDDDNTIKSFITNMYNNHLYLEESFLKQHCTPNMLEKLQNEFKNAYDTEGVHYATWLFRTSAQNEKPNSDMETRVIEVEADGDGWYTYSFYDGGWYGKNKIKAFVQDGEVMMDDVQVIEDEASNISQSAEQKNWMLTGYFEDETGKNPIRIWFTQVGDELQDCIFQNVTLGGKIRMQASLTDNGFRFEGKDGNNAFIINVSTDNENGGWSGSAFDGPKELYVYLQEE